MRTSHHNGPLHRRVFMDAARIAWSHKHLWVFGFFAGMAGFGGATDALFGTYERPAKQAISGDAMFPILPHPAEFGSMGERVLFLALAAVMAAFFVWIASVAIGALIASIRSVSRGGEPTFHGAITEGRSHFWRVLGVNLAAKAVAFTAGGLIAAALVTLLVERTATSALMYLGVFILFTAIAVLASVTGAFATIEAVSKDVGAIKALEDGFAVAVSHWLTSLETAILLAISAILLAVGSAIAVAILSIPVIFLIVIAATVQANALVAALVALTAVVLLCAFVLMASFYGAFQAAVWTLLWHELAEGRGTPKLARWFRHLHIGKK